MTMFDRPMQRGRDVPTTDPPEDEREWAQAHIARRRKLRTDVVSYLVVNAFLVLIWLMTGAGYFWPAWVLAGWGVALALDVWGYLQHQPITAADVDRELRTRR